MEVKVRFSTEAVYRVRESDWPGVVAREEDQDGRWVLLLLELLEQGDQDLDAAEREIVEAIFEPLDEDYVLVSIVLKRKS